VVVVAIPGLAACGSKKKTKSMSTTTTTTAPQPSVVAFAIVEQGKAAKFTVPSTVPGGLVDLKLTNAGKAPHSAQLIRFAGGHTAQDALKAVGGNSHKTPAWLYGEGGVGATGPGQSSDVVQNLPAGKYVAVDLGAGGPPSGPPTYSEFTVTPGTDGKLPATPTTITAAAPAKDKYEWQIAGSLQPGSNRLTFVSKGKDALHFIGAFRVTGHPSKAAIIKALKSNGKPPAFVDQSSNIQTTVIDGGKSQVLSLDLPGSKSGDEYVLFCPLTDRDGGKPHFAEGLVTTVKIS
jgi:hypothetical protein